MKIDKLLNKIKDPIFNEPLSKITKIILEGDKLTLKSKVPLKNGIEALKAAIFERSGDSIKSVNVYNSITTYQTQIPNTKIDGVKNIIAVASGKGGVGKTTIAVNLALALSALGANVGIFDADIYGPNVPLKLGIKTEQADVTKNNRFMPISVKGLQVMSIALLMDQEKPMIWRGPILSNTLQQLIKQTAWDNLDYLIVDLPPGTGDSQLTLSQKIPVVGAVVVSTPHDMANQDALKGIRMFEKLTIPVLGLVQNMVYFECPKCHHQEDLLKHVGGNDLEKVHKIETFAKLPIAKEIALSLYSNNKEFDQYKVIFDQMAVKLLKALLDIKPHPSANMPNISIV